MAKAVGRKLSEYQLKEIKRILIIQYKPFGDVLLNTAYIPYLKKKLPDAEIHFMVKKPYDQALYKNPHIDKLIIFEDKKKLLPYLFHRFKIIKLIRKNRYDMVIDQLRDTGSAIFTFFSGAEFKLGFIKKRYNFIYNIRVAMGKKRYYAMMKFDLLKPLGINEESGQLYFYIDESSCAYVDEWLNSAELQKNNFILISPGSPVKRKRWRPDNFAELADRIQKEIGLKTLFIGSPSERHYIIETMKIMRSEFLLCPETSLNQAAAFLSRCRLLVCNDGGLNHLSIATDTPSLSIFGTTNPDKWSGSELKDHWVMHDPENCGKDDSFGISVSEAFNKVNEIINIKDGKADK